MALHSNQLSSLTKYRFLVFGLKAMKRAVASMRISNRNLLFVAGCPATGNNIFFPNRCFYDIQPRGSMSILYSL